MKPHSHKFIRKRKFYMALPVLVIPFMTMFFWALGGGNGNVAAETDEFAGLNMKLPDARFNEELNTWDKLSLYQKASRDSLKRSQAKKNDPYFRLSILKVSQDTLKRDSTKGRGVINASLGDRKEPLDETEARVYKKLSELQKHLDKSARAPGKRPAANIVPQASHATFENDIDRLESMMVMMQNDPAQDKEMEEINGVLNKILDIQHPERIQERLATAASDIDNTYSTGANPTEEQVGWIGNSLGAEAVEENRFYGLEEPVVGMTENSAIKAEIYGDQNLVSGSVIKMELLQDISVNGIRIPKNRFVFGECALNGDRLAIKVSSIQYDNVIFPVSLTVYDIDGLEGIHVPGAIARDAAKKASNQAVQGIQVSGFDPSLEVQAANAGIEAAKGMLSKKTRLIQVTIKAGYKVYLKDNNTQHSQSKR